MFAVTTKECIHCRQTGTVMVDPKKYIEFTQTPRHLRRLIQDIFPECFDDMFRGEGE